jgi:hypothetical protein
MISRSFRRCRAPCGMTGLSGVRLIGGNVKMATRKKKGKKARPMFDDGPGPHVKRAKKKASKKK